MSRAKLLAGILLGTALLGTALVAFVKAETPSHSAALTGKVTSSEEGPMEGVVVGAKKAGSTITTWVVSDAQGRYSFPRDRMDDGKYAISIRAVGYELPGTSVDVTSEPAQLDLQLNKLKTNSKLALQLSNAEWFASVPGTDEEKSLIGNCVTCHTLQRILFSRFDADQMAPVVSAWPCTRTTLRPCIPGCVP